jgi:PPOX class probable F420-dependent enzyme
MTDEALKQFLRTHRNAVLATARKDGRPQLSRVLAVYRDNDTIWMSITEDRVKYRNLVRDPRATVMIDGDSPWQYAVISGRASMTHMPEALPMLREYYESSSGAHPNWEEYDEAMRRDRRVLLELSVDHVDHAFNVGG